MPRIYHEILCQKRNKSKSRKAFATPMQNLFTFFFSLSLFLRNQKFVIAFRSRMSTTWQYVPVDDPNCPNSTTHIYSLSLPSPHHSLSSFYLSKIRTVQNTVERSESPTGYHVCMVAYRHPKICLFFFPGEPIFFSKSALTVYTHGSPRPQKASHDIK